jgi:hypothetical protein
MARRWKWRKGVVAGSTAQARAASTVTVSSQPDPVEITSEVVQWAVLACQDVPEEPAHAQIVLHGRAKGRIVHQCTSGHGVARAATAATSAAA